MTRRAATTLDVLLRSARVDAPPPGARARALARLAESRARAGAMGGHTAGALLAVVLMLLATSGIATPSEVQPVHDICSAGIEGPPTACSHSTVSSSDRRGGASDGVGSSSGVPGAWRSGG
jgi:hypothetical protein